MSTSSNRSWETVAVPEAFALIQPMVVVRISTATAWGSSQRA